MTKYADVTTNDPQQANFTLSLRMVIADYQLLQTLLGLMLAEGDAVVLKPAPIKGNEIVGRIRASNWRMLAPIAQSSSSGGSGRRSGERF